MSDELIESILLELIIEIIKMENPPERLRQLTMEAFSTLPVATREKIETVIDRNEYLGQ